MSIGTGVVLSPYGLIPITIDEIEIIARPKRVVHDAFSNTSHTLPEGDSPCKFVCRVAGAIAEWWLGLVAPKAGPPQYKFTAELSIMGRRATARGVWPLKIIPFSNRDEDEQRVELHADRLSSDALGEFLSVVDRIGPHRC